MIAALKRFRRWLFTKPRRSYPELVQGTAAYAAKEILEHAAPFLTLDKFNALPMGKVKFRRPQPFKPIIPEPQAADWRRECIAKALYLHWAEENELDGPDYVCWRMLPDKRTWYSRAEAVIAADPKE